MLREAASTLGVTQQVKQTAVGLSSLLLWIHSHFLPAGDFLRTEIHPGMFEATRCPASAACSGTDQT